MSTKKNTGVRNHNTNRAPTQAGSGVTVNPSAVVPPVATPPATGTTPAAAAPVTEITSSQLLEAEAGAKNFREGLAILVAALRPSLRLFPNRNAAWSASASGPRKEAAALYAGLLRQFPNVTSMVDPGVIDAGLAVDAAMGMIKSDLQQILPLVEFCGRQSAVLSCSEATVVRTAAKGQAGKDTALAAAITSINGVLRRGKRVSTSADAAAKAQAAATKTQQRAAAVAAKAQAKAAKAARSAARVVQAHADNHPTTPDVVIVPAGTTTPATAPGTPNGTPPKG